MTKKRRGSLSPKTYFPKKGDVFLNTGEGSTWTCERVSKIQDKQTGDSFKVAMFIGHHPDLEGRAIPLVINSSEDIRRRLEDYDRILRPDKSGDMVEYFREEDGYFRTPA